MKDINEIRRKVVKLGRLSNPKMKDLCEVFLELIEYIEERDVKSCGAR